MTLHGAAALFLVVHCALCAGFAAVHVLRPARMPGYFLPFAACVPVWGPAIALVFGVCGWRPETHPAASAFRDREAAQGVARDDGASLDADAVPLEEALLINDAAQRRRLMLAVLNEDPEDYLSILRNARLNDDTEVVHYAATAMAALARDADLELQRLERAWNRDRSDAAALAAYCGYLERYLASGLLEGRAEQACRRRFIELLEVSPDEDDGYARTEKIARASLDAGDLERADAATKRLVERWPRREGSHLARIGYAAARKDADELRAAVALARESGAYLSADGREALAFWEADEEGKETS